jgi:uncharacterized protein YndB with AHSA1/START domain
MASFTIKKSIAAPPETVFAVLTDHRAYPDYTPIRKAELEKEGVPAPNGVGAVRKLHSVGPPLREEVVEYEPSTKFVYRLLSGAPLKDHVGTVTLAPDGAGTLMVYTVDTTPTLPVGGGLVVGVVKRAVGQLASGVAKESEKRG